MRLNSVEVTAGLFIVAIGGFFALGALDYQIGSAHRMGPGYYPLAVGGLTMMIGLVILGQSFFLKRETRPASWRPFFFISLAIGIFGLTVERLGLMPAAILVVLTSAVGSEAGTFRGTIVLALGVALCSWLIFGLGLGLPLPAIAGL
ncbi:MAG: tripartite tricarboxylate transporter TctB family protein [Salinarimonadaceae bacterium]|nr:MAG: tripartite tricarboxylate transporter TctB family protein [Salinarimonadaceae bacterium]